MRWAAWSAVPLLVLAARPARGQATAQALPPDDAAPHVFYPPPRVLVFAALTYERGPGAEACPGEDTLRLEAASRLGHDPFEPNPTGIEVGDVRVVVTKEPGGFVARYAWTGSPDVCSPAGRFDEPGRTRRDCYDLLADVAVSFGGYFLLLEIKYGAELAPKKRAPACPSAERAAPAPCVESRFSVWPTEWPLPPFSKPEPSARRRPERWPLAIRVGAAVWPELIASGWGSLGFSADVGVRWRWFSASAEVHGDPPLGSQSFQNLGAVSFARISGGALLCGHFGWFTGCGAADVGRVLFPRHVHYLPASTFYGAAGMRAGFDFPVAPPWLFLRAAVDLRAPIRPASYAPAGHDIFRMAGPSVGLGLGLLAELPP